MSIFRQPKGTYTRGTNDWFQATRASAVGEHNHVGAGVESFALYNNDPVGRFLSVNDLACGTDVPDTYLIALAQGNAGTLFSTPYGCFPINPLLPGVSGQLYFGATALAPANLLYQTTGNFITLELGYMIDAPFWIVPPGWSLAVQTGGSAHAFVLNIQYAVISS